MKEIDVEHFAQEFMLGLFLTDYPELLSYDQLLTMMAEEPDWESEITPWSPFQNYDGVSLSGIIHAHKDALVRGLQNA
jgi:hypothetical protein